MTTSTHHDPHYLGEVCHRHPQDMGRRYKSNKVCVACARAMSKVQYAIKTGKAPKGTKAFKNGGFGTKTIKQLIYESVMAKHKE